jgi:ketosteroid isomerase-like protein
MWLLLNMGIVDTFDNFAADFEAAVADDDWSRLEKHLADDATYLNVGGPEPKCEGRASIIAFLKADVSHTDRRFDSRTLIALTPPTAKGNRLTRQWRCTYTLAGVPDLVVEGEARYVIENDLIKEIEEELAPISMQNLDEWMRNYGDRLKT